MKKKQPKLIDTFQYRYLFQILFLFTFFLIITVFLTIAFTLIVFHWEFFLSRYWLWTWVYCLLLAFLLGLLFFRWIFRYSLRIVLPIHQLKSSLSRLLAGNTEQTLKVEKRMEWAELLRLYNKVLKKINADMSLYHETLLDTIKELDVMKELITQLPPCAQKTKLLERVKQLQQSCLLENKE